MKTIYQYILCLCIAITIAVYFMYGLYSLSSNNNKNKSRNNFKLCSRTSSPPQNYDAHITGLDSSRLGYAILPQFQIKPKTWNNILKDVKLKLLATQQNGGGNINYETTSSNSTPKPKLMPQPPMTMTESQITIREINVAAKPKQILIYEAMWWRELYGKCTEDKGKNLKFPCEYSYWYKMKGANKSLVLADVVTNFDAVVKYGEFGDRNKIIQSLNSYPNGNTLTGKRTKLIYTTMEAPGEFQVQLKPRIKDGTRDVLASYWRGSDIYTPYFRWEYYNENITFKHQTKNFAAGRTRMAAIIVSNCHSHNNRLGFVMELQKYIQVDIFGKCGTFPCPKRGTGDCFSKIKKHYKFYLAFENTMCRDYITEKLSTNAFGNDLLPIVMGAHPSDYKTIAPANSYIHIEDFESIAELGRFLLQLHEDDSLYNSYFAWKGTGEFRNWYLCEYCAYLYAEDARNVLGFEEFRESSFAITALTKEKAIPFLNMDDTYEHDVFNVSRQTEDSYKLCLKNNVWYWNR